MNLECFSPIGALRFWVARHGLDPECLAILQATSEPTITSLVEYLPLFGLTLLLESPLYFLFLRQRLPLKSIAKASLLANLATHPAVAILFPWAAWKLTMGYGTYLSVAEVFAPTVEALVLYLVWKIPAKLSVAAAVVTNLTSWWLGIYIYSALFY